MIRELLLLVGLLAPVETFAFGWNNYPIPELAKPGAVLGGYAGATPKIWIPLQQYLHPFSSFIYLPKLNQCVVTITSIGSGGIGPHAWMCAFIAQIGACNGSPDVDGNQLNADGTHRRGTTSGPTCAGWRACGYPELVQGRRRQVIHERGARTLF
jgi:hypothetical protein